MTHDEYLKKKIISSSLVKIGYYICVYFLGIIRSLYYDYVYLTNTCKTTI